MEDTLDNRIWNSVQTEPTYSSNPSDYVDHWKRFLDAELASLREQLKQKEEVIRELIPIVDYYHDKQVQYTEMPYKNWNDIIDKAKKLLEPQ